MMIINQKSQSTDHSQERGLRSPGTRTMANTITEGLQIEN